MPNTTQITMAELLNAAKVLGIVDTDIIKRGVPRSSFYVQKKKPLTAALPVGWHDTAQAIIIEAAALLNSAPHPVDDNTGNGHAHVADIPDYEPGDTIELNAAIDDNRDDEAAADTAAEDDLDDESAPDEAPQLIPATAPANVMQALLAQASTVQTLEAATDVLTAAANAFASQTQATALSNAILAALPRRTITRAALLTDFRNARAAAVALARAAATGGDADDGDRESQTQMLAALLREKDVTFHVDGRNDAPVVRMGPNCILPLDDPWFVGQIYDWWEESMGADKVPTKQAIDDIMRRARARAGKEPPSFSTDIRYHTKNRVKDGVFTGVESVVIDLGGASRSALRVSHERIETLTADDVADAGYHFLTRPTHPPMIAYDPKATPETALKALESLCRFEDPAGARVLFGAIIAQMIAGEATKCVLVFTGDGGSGKTSAALLVVLLLDGQTELNGDAKDAEDFLIVSQDAALVSADNVSHIDTKLANMLCRIVQPNKNKRRGYFTQSAKTFAAHATVVLTTTTEGGAVNREDLLDRGVIFKMRPPPTGAADDARMTEQAAKALMRKSAPIILGGMLKAVQQLLPHLDYTKTVSPDRLASVANVMAALDAADVCQGGFLQAFSSMRTQGALDFTVADAVGRSLAALALKHGKPDPFYGVTWSEPFNKVWAKVAEWGEEHKTNRERYWPQHSDAFSKMVSRLAAVAAKAGMTISRGRTGHERTRTLEVTLTHEAAKAAQAAAVDAGHVFDKVTDIKSPPAVIAEIKDINGKIARITNSPTVTAGQMQLEKMFREMSGLRNRLDAGPDHLPALRKLLEAMETAAADGIARPPVTPTTVRTEPSDTPF